MVISIVIYFIQFSLKNIINMGTKLSYAYYLRKMSILPVSGTVFYDKSSFYIKQFFHYMSLTKMCNS